MSSPLRIAVGADGVSIWSSEIFGEPAAPQVDGEHASRITPIRQFLTRAFSVQEVEKVELRPAAAFGRIRYKEAANPAKIWKKLSRALGASNDSSTEEASVDFPSLDAGSEGAGVVYLDGPGAGPIHVSRVGNALSTWRVRQQRDGELHLSHPALRNRRDVVFRLEEELVAILGVERFRASAITGSLSIHFDRRQTTAGRLATELERAWPRLLDGLDGPPSRKRLVASVGLVGLAFAGQYLVPALRPLAVLSVAIYSSPNVVKAARQLSRGEVGLPALYSYGLAFMLITGLPFTASVMAMFMQLWPQLAHRKLVASQRRLFGSYRLRPAWARGITALGAESELSVDRVGKGQLVIVRSGETVPVDGIVESGFAAVVSGFSWRGKRAEDKAKGDEVLAGALVRDGTLTIRVERAGAETHARYVASLLPRGAVAGLPSSLEAERVANRNVKPALGVSILTLLLTRTPQQALGVTRPDYATGPRLSAQLSALNGLADGLRHGILFQNPAAIDRIATSDLYAIDASAGIARRRIRIERVESIEGVSPEQVVAYALAAQVDSGSERSRALGAFAQTRKLNVWRAPSAQPYAGGTRYRDHLGSAIEIVSAQPLALEKFDSAAGFRTVIARRGAPRDRPEPSESTGQEAQARPLWVVRDGKAIGVISFARTGETIGEHVVPALLAKTPNARLVYVSRGDDADDQVLARKLGLEIVHERLSGSSADRFRARQVLWIGNGRDSHAHAAIASSAVSVSVAPLSHARDDVADVLLPDADLSALPELVAIGHAHASRLATDYRTVNTANLLGSSGGLFARFSTLQVALMSNLGTGLVYARRARALNQLA